jgi:hypothetical protein
MTTIDRIIRLSRKNIAEVILTMRSGNMSVSEFYRRMSEILIRYHALAISAGLSGKTPDSLAYQYTQQSITTQLGYLGRFINDVADQPWSRAFERRAMLYAESVKDPYWSAFSNFVQLPGLPGQGTACMMNCRCSWEKTVLDEAAGYYVYSWRRHSGESCFDCIAREQDWRMVEVRGTQVTVVPQVPLVVDSSFDFSTTF